MMLRKMKEEKFVPASSLKSRKSLRLWTGLLVVPTRLTRMENLAK